MAPAPRRAGPAARAALCAVHLHGRTPLPAARVQFARRACPTLLRALLRARQPSPPRALSSARPRGPAVRFALLRDRGRFPSPGSGPAQGPGEPATMLRAGHQVPALDGTRRVPDRCIYSTVGPPTPISAPRESSGSRRPASRQCGHCFEGDRT